MNDLPSNTLGNSAGNSPGGRGDHGPGRLRIDDLTYWNPRLRGGLAGLLLALVVWGMASSHSLDGAEDGYLDEAFLWRGRRASGARIVIVALDEETLRQMGKHLAYISPELARVVSYLRSQQVAAIGIDLMVPEYMSTHPDIVEPDRSGFAVPLGRAIREAGNVVLPYWFATDPGDPRVRELRRPIHQWLLKALDEELRSETDLGFVNVKEDGDQFLRRQQLVAQEDGELRLHFAYALHCVASGEPVRLDSGRPLLCNRPVPVDALGRIRVNYVGPPGAFPVVPFHEVLRREQTREGMPELRDAAVIVGVTAQGKQDYHSTPYANHWAARWLGKTHGKMSGCEFHAHILATLADGAYLWEWPTSVALFLLLVLGAGLGLAYSHLGLGGGLLFCLGSHWLWKAFALLAFSVWYLRVPVASFLLLNGCLFVVTMGLNWRQLRGLLRVFISGPIAEAVQQHPGRLTGRYIEVRQVTVLFADIRDFTRYGQGHTPEQVARMLESYFDLIVPIVEKHHGVLNTYMGDGIMAIFGAPLDDPEQAHHAVEAAIEMVRKVGENASLWRQQGFDPFHIGVGIHTGPTAVGAIGSAGRLHYTVVGDTPNTASRIESQNKVQNTAILISAATRAALGAAAQCLGCEPTPRRVSLAGFREPFAVYEVGGAASGRKV